MARQTDVLDDVAAQLRRAGLSLRLDASAGMIHVGSELRGDGAPAAVVELHAHDAHEYLELMRRRGPREYGPIDDAVGYLGTLVLESLIGVHDGENNLTDRVYLDRGSDGALGLAEHRITARAPSAPDDGPLAWTAERP